MMEVRPLRSGADYDAALEAIEAFFETERNPALPRPIVSICLLVVADYERKHWALNGRCFVRRALRVAERPERVRAFDALEDLPALVAADADPVESTEVSPNGCGYRVHAFDLKHCTTS
jgi:antitoxin component HigA of HigAB toxin-antitoxin module